MATTKASSLGKKSLDGRSALAGILKGDSRLQGFYLEGVIPRKRKLGDGPFGSAFEVSYHNATYVAKQIHETFIEGMADDTHRLIEKYRRECQLMASLRHTNIVHFLGLSSQVSSPMPALILERLTMSLEDLLECTCFIPLPVKLSILVDTCAGLEYLHSLEPQVVHRNLTARNVLLTSSLVAKITDIGAMKLVSLKRGQFSQLMFQHPRTAVYMPPEAISDSVRCGPSVDVFSFGHLALYVLIQIFPGDFLPSKGRSELDHRKAYIDKLESYLGNSHPVLLELIKLCFRNSPGSRPSSQDLLGRLKALKIREDRVQGKHIIRQIKVQQIMRVKGMMEEKQKMKDFKEAMEETTKEIMIAHEKLEMEYKNQKESLSKLEQEKKQLQATEEALRMENEELKMELEWLRNEQQKPNMSPDRKEFRDRKKALALDGPKRDKRKHQFASRTPEMKRSEKIHSSPMLMSKDEVKQKSSSLQGHGSQQSKPEVAITRKSTSHLEGQRGVKANQLKPDTRKSTSHLDGIRNLKKIDHSVKDENDGGLLQLSKWKSGQDMPFAMTTFIQSVVIGNTLYVGGGLSYHGNKHRVMAFNNSQSNWTLLPPYRAKWYGMTSINDSLILVGGFAEGRESARLGVWNTASKNWTHPLPAMPTPRWCPSAIVYKHMVVVAGGYKDTALSTVEALDINTNQWFAAPSTPVPWWSMKSTIIGETWYLMGGCQDCSAITDVYSVPLESLVSTSVSNSGKVWRSESSLDVCYCCPFEIGGNLLAVGGKNVDTGESSAMVYCYVPGNKSWVLAGELPHALHSCTCADVSGSLYVMGGQSGPLCFASVFNTISTM